MGLILGQTTKEQLIGYKNQLEAKKMSIMQAKMTLSESVSDLANVGNDMDPESPVVKQLEQRKQRLNLLEKELDKQMEEIEVRLKMVEGNIKAADEMINSALKG